MQAMEILQQMENALRERREATNRLYSACCRELSHFAQNHLSKSDLLASIAHWTSISSLAIKHIELQASSVLGSISSPELLSLIEKIIKESNEKMEVAEKKFRTAVQSQLRTLSSERAESELLEEVKSAYEQFSSRE
eukprot:TRINITY_DN9306_c0_g1_i1.p1 TRINITY_DN9306_c0_g1~~TRINITY_DN9306_c0_g1_i1.p1  ORF type:complete len:137 (-),score=29.01 TRINITY_DN9306_c0_g1_i1:144-554(-)